MASPAVRPLRRRSRVKAGAALCAGLLTALLGVAAGPAQAPAQAVSACTATGVANTTNYETDTIYQVLTDRFADGDPSNNNPYGKANSYDPSRTDINRFFGGDWRGLADRMPYLTGMGISAIWISPPYNNLDDPYLENGNYYNAYHGYWAKDYFVPDEHWGGWADFDALVETAHAHGIKVVIDFAPNHTNHTDNVEQGALYREGTLIGRHNNDTLGLYHHEGNRAPSQTSQYDYQFRDLANLADLSTENAFVQDHLLDAIDVWLSHGVDGIRNDATLHQSNAFRTVLADHVNASSTPVFHFGEYFIGTPDPKYDDYRTSPDRTGIDILDFELANVARATFGDFSQSMLDLKAAVERTDGDYTYEHNSVTWLDSHDKPRLASIQPNQGIFHAALAFHLTTRGTPVIYYGTEQYLPGANGDAGRVWMNSFDTTTPAYRLIGDLAELRKENPALAYGTTTFRWENSNVLIYERKFFDNTVLIAINRSGTTYPITGLSTALPPGTYPDYLGGLTSGNALTVNSTGAVTPFDLGPAEVAVWSYRDTTPAGPQIGAVGPTQGRAGNVVAIDGEGFGTSAGTVSFGGAPAAVQCWSPHQIKVTVPAVAPGTVDVTVSTSNATSNTYQYTVVTGKQVQVIFHVNEATTAPGENVYVVGNVRELGGWDPAKPFEAMLNPAYPEWFLPISVPAGHTLEFKFIKRDATGKVTWESGTNRTFTAPSSGTADTPMYTWRP
ncbi:alpha-amylase family glycosyl hydrolase [Microbacterium lacusdiani]